MSALKPQVEWMPEGKTTSDWVDGYVRGVELILKRKGVNTDYNTLMGDIGMAFIMQGEDMNKMDGAVDIGWWPNEPMSLIRLDFLGRTLGFEVKEIRAPEDQAAAVKRNPAEAFAKWYKPEIASTLTLDMPCIIGYPSSQYIVTGLDDNAHPLIGMCPNEKKGNERIYRIEETLPPWKLVVVGKTLPTMDRAKADRQALSYALALHHDTILGTSNDTAAAAFALPVGEVNAYRKWHWHTGKETFGIWIRCLEDIEHPGQARWHANAQSILVRNRKAAIAYLRDMQKRHGADVNMHLESACKHYESVVAEMQKANISDETIKSKPGREALAAIVKQVAMAEDNAALELEAALRAMK